VSASVSQPRSVAVPAPSPRPAAAPPLRLSGRASAVLGAILVIVAVFATDQVVPATSAYEAQIRVWLAARAAGVATLVLLAFQIVMGLLLSHPTNRTTWRLSKRVFPWHEHMWVFVAAFLAVHIVSILMDPYAGVGLDGAFIPGLSSYRSAPVALGTLATYAFLVTALTARYTKLLPPGTWLVLHRLALVVFVFSWLHGMLAGTDSLGLLALYVVLALAVGAAATYRYWIVRRPLRRAEHVPYGGESR
jgi:methionine sulfoxide reductase heme-binding subunit